MADRGVSVVVNYVLMLLLVSLLTGVLFAGVGDIVENQHERAVLSELDVEGNRLAAHLSAADRLVRLSAAPDGVRVSVRLVDQVVGSPYKVHVSAVGSDRYELVLRSTRPEITATTVVRSQTPVEPTTLHGGTLDIEYNGTTGRLEVSRA